jgi:hypothetical protein
MSNTPDLENGQCRPDSRLEKLKEFLKPIEIAPGESYQYMQDRPWAVLDRSSKESGIIEPLGRVDALLLD